MDYVMAFFRWLYFYFGFVGIDSNETASKFIGGGQSGALFSRRR
jgi:hypothetical protein